MAPPQSLTRIPVDPRHLLEQFMAPDGTTVKVCDGNVRSPRNCAQPVGHMVFFTEKCADQVGLHSEQDRMSTYEDYWQATARDRAGGGLLEMSFGRVEEYAMIADHCPPHTGSLGAIYITDSEYPPDIKNRTDAQYHLHSEVGVLSGWCTQSGYTVEVNRPDAHSDYTWTESHECYDGAWEEIVESLGFSVPDRPEPTDATPAETYPAGMG